MTRLVVRACAVLSHRIPTAIVSCSELGARLHASRGYAAVLIRVIPNGGDTIRFAFSEEARARVRREFGFAERVWALYRQVAAR